MCSTRTILLAALAAAGFTATEAEALTPLALDASVDPTMFEGPSEHATLAPSAFARPSDDTYEPTAYIANKRARSQCVPFARREGGVEIYGDANTWWRQAAGVYERVAMPEESSVMVLRGYANANRGHVAVVREIVSARMIIVDHANWLNGGEITRNVPIRDVSEHGDWSQVQVWNVTGRHWGGRTYEVQGFILNVLEDVKAQVAAEQQTAAQVPVG